MRNKWKSMLAIVMACLMLLGTTAYAHEGRSKGEDDDKQSEWKQKEHKKDDSKAIFGFQKITYADGVSMIVKDLDLNLNAFVFVKEPQASDSFDKVPNDAWYAKAFVIAALNGLDLPRNVEPKAYMTREEFTHYLFKAMMLKGDFAFTKIFFTIKDEADINAAYKPDIQLMLNAKIVQLDKDGRFLPKKPITKKDASAMLKKTVQFVKAHQPTDPGTVPPTDEKVTMTPAKVTDQINKVTLAWGEKPNAGYRLVITGIKFTADMKAEIHYSLLYPDKDHSYAQVITYPQAETFISAAYTPVIVQDK